MTDSTRAAGTPSSTTSALCGRGSEPGRWFTRARERQAQAAALDRQDAVGVRQIGAADLEQEHTFTVAQGVAQYIQDAGQQRVAHHLAFRADRVGDLHVL